MQAPPRSTELAVARHIRGQTQARQLDREIGILAKGQHGVVARRQLIALGLGEDAIDSRLRTGRLWRLHRGVYAVGHDGVSRDGRWLAAVLTVGEGAVLSHRSAAELWGVWRVIADHPIDVSAPSSTRPPPGIRRHYLHLTPFETTTRSRIPVTRLARTLFDIAGETSEEGLEGAIREAEYLHRFRLAELEALLEHHPGRRGARTIRACLRRLGRSPRGRVRSRMEVRFAALLARSDLPEPQLNAILDLGDRRIEADCLWPEQRVVVELDGAAAHRTRVAFESDRERDRRLQAAGWRVVRITWRQLDDPAALVADLRRLFSPSLRLPAS